MEGGLRGESQRKKEQYVCLSVSAEGERGRGNRGWGGVIEMIGGVFAPWHWTCFFGVLFFVFQGEKIKGETETMGNVQ